MHNSRLIYVAGSGYGPKGPEAMEPSFDIIGQARSGIMTQVGEPGMPPLTVRGAAADQMGGIMMAYATLAALIARERLGVGQKVDSSLLGGMISLLGLPISNSLFLGAEPAETQLRPRTKATNPLYSNWYLCQDGRWLALGLMQSDRYWPTFCKILGIEHLEKDTKFENWEKRRQNNEELITILDKLFKTKPAAEWVKILREKGDIACTVIQKISDLVNDPQVLANEYIIERHHAVLGPVKITGLPIQLSQTPGEVRCEAPEFGQHTEEVLLEIGGYNWEEIAQLRDEEVI